MIVDSKTARPGYSCSGGTINYLKLADYNHIEFWATYLAAAQHTSRGTLR